MCGEVGLDLVWCGVIWFSFGLVWCGFIWFCLVSFVWLDLILVVRLLMAARLCLCVCSSADMHVCVFV